MGGNKLTLNMIVKNETDDLVRCIESCKDYVDDIVIINTGNNPETSKIIQKYGKEYTYKWNNSFADARNFALSKVETELVLWLDADDTVAGAETLPSLKEQFNNEQLGALWCYYNYDQDEYGNTTMVVWRERILRKKWFKWSGNLHEECLKQMDCVQQKVPQEQLFILHHPAKDRIEKSAKRNLEISEANYVSDHEANNVDPFNVWNYARSLNALGLVNEAIPVFEEFIVATQSDEHRYQALSVLSESFRKTRQYDKALDADLKCIKIRPRWANAYFNIAKTYFCREDWDNVIFYTQLGYKMEKPGENLPVPYDPMELTYRPLEPLVYALVQKARFEEALVATHKALEYKPKNEYFLRWAKVIPIAVRNRDIEKSCWKVYEYYKETPEEEYKIKDFIACLPEPAKDHPEFVHLRNKFSGYNDGSNRVVIYCGSSYTLWDAKSENEGIGGSEEAVINISRELVKLGWQVEVYNNCLDEGIHDGVLWQGIWKYDPKQPARIFICWRDTRSIDLAPENSYCCLWLHDVCSYEHFTPRQLDRVDKIFVLSKWHRTCLPEIPDDKFWYTTNGIIPEHFKEKVVRNPYACIYASSPDRGLDRVLASWPRIREAVPEAELNVFYGFTQVYDEVHKNNQAMKEFKENILAKLKQPGITYHGMVSHKELAKWMLYSGVWLYPTSFTEISCCTGDTLIEMPRDHIKYPKGIPIKELVGKSGFPVYSYDADTDRIVLGTVNWVAKTRKDAEIWRLTLDDGTYLEATGDHRIMLRDGVYKELKNLVPDESLMPVYARVNHMIKQNNGKWVDEHRMVGEWKKGRKLRSDEHVDHKDSTRNNNSPEMLEVMSESEHHSKTHTGKKRTKQQSEKQSKSFKEYCKTDKGKKQLSKNGTNRANKFWQVTFKEWPEEKQKEFLGKRVETRKLNNHRVVSVVNTGRKEDVYDMEVEKYHNFGANGIIIHNCITGMKAQASGAIPITTTVAALDETVQYGEKIRGARMEKIKQANAPAQQVHIIDTEALEEWTVKAIDYIKHPEKQESIRREMIDWALKEYSWSAVAEKWSRLFKGVK